jgi:hypothetical protein
VENVINDSTGSEDCIKRNVQLFNQPVEVGIRVLILLQEIHPRGCDFQRMIYYDYLMVHSGDVEGGPPSLHPATPHRSCEILVRRKLMQAALSVLQSKRLAKIEFGGSGITYSCTDLSGRFLEYFSSTYAMQLKEKAKWVVGKFGELSDDEMELFIKTNLGRWGSEFTRESVVRGACDDEHWLLSE